MYKTIVAMTHTQTLTLEAAAQLMLCFGRSRCASTATTHHPTVI